jgi:hypothetical protein
MQENKQNLSLKQEGITTTMQLSSMNDKEGEELRETCIKIQAATGIQDAAWKVLYGNDEGLYGFIKSRDQQIALEARIDEIHGVQRNPDVDLEDRVAHLEGELATLKQAQREEKE